MSKRLIFLALLLYSISFGYSAAVLEQNINDYFASTLGGDYVYNENNVHNALLEVVRPWLGAARDFYCYLPVTYNVDTPVIIALHGSQRSGLSMIDAWSEIAKKDSVIIIAPNGLNGNWNYSNADFKLIKTAFKNVAKKYKLKTKTPFLFGHSSGGVFALLLAAEHPDLFPVVAVHAAAIPDNMRVFAKSKSDYLYSRIAILVGDQDSVFSMEQVRQTAKKLAGLGLDTRLFFLINHNHWYYNDFNRINNYIWTFYHSN